MLAPMAISSAWSRLTSARDSALKARWCKAPVFLRLIVSSVKAVRGEVMANTILGVATPPRETHALLVRRPTSSSDQNPVEGEVCRKTARLLSCLLRLSECGRFSVPLRSIFFRYRKNFHVPIAFSAIESRSYNVKVILKTVF